MPRYRVVLVTIAAKEYTTKYFESTRAQNSMTSAMVGDMVTQMANLDHIRIESEDGTTIRTISIDTNIKEWLEAFGAHA